MRHHTAAGLLLAAGLTLAGCSTSSSHHTTPTPTTPSAPATSSAPAKLSTTWLPKLAAHSKGDGDGTRACQQPSSEECVTAISSDLDMLNALLDDINSTPGGTRYTRTVTQAQKMTQAAMAYTRDHCVGDPAADREGSPCYGDAVTVTVGMATLQQVIPTDELDAS